MTDRSFERIEVYGPGEHEAGLAVTLHENPGPHETRITVDQLWPPRGDDEHGTAEPVYVGDATRAVSLIEALARVVEIDLEIQEAEGP